MKETDGGFTVPVFPLNTVLMPGGFLPLQIFEPRYLDLVRDCVRDESPFGVCLILETEQPDKRSQHVRIGTLARIRDWNTMENGLLSIVCQGHERFSIQATRMRDNGLMIADVALLADASPVEIPEQYHLLAEIVGRFMDKLESNYPGFERAWLMDADWVGFRLAELLPIRNLERQALLEMEAPLDRLQTLLELLPRFQ